MDKNDKIDFDSEVVGDEAELTMDDLKSNYVKNPKVGESITLAIAKIVKNPNVEFVTRDGTKINKSLSGVKFNWEIHTTDGKIYSCSVWEVVGKLKEICRELGKTKGFCVRIAHIRDGKAGKKGPSNYTVELVSKTV